MRTGFGKAIRGLAFAAGGLLAQTESGQPAFDVASIKLNTTCQGKGAALRVSPGRLEVTCYTLRGLIWAAYSTNANGSASARVRPILVGEPSWASSDTYDIVATAPGVTSSAQIAGPMLQQLLEDRFSLRMHRGTQESDVFLLSLAKGGLKLKELPDGSCVPDDPLAREQNRAPAAGSPPVCDRLLERRSRGQITVDGGSVTLGALASGFLMGVVRMRVLDKTGIAGRYQIHLEFADPMLPEADGVSLSTALQQIGLKLDRGKGAIETLVIDRVERPAEN